MWWRLLEVGERIESGDEWYDTGHAKRWKPYSLAIGQIVSVWEVPARRRGPSSGADFSAGKDRPEKLVKLGDHVGINCGTWFGCTGRVTFVFNTSERCCVELDNVYAGGNRLVITEPLDNVTVLVEPVAETLSPENCPVCGVIS